MMCMMKISLEELKRVKPVRSVDVEEMLEIFHCPSAINMSSAYIQKYHY